MRRLRVFIAVTPPKDFQDKIEKVQEKLQKQGFTIKWEDAQKSHITLVFLGHISQARMEDASGAAQKSAQEIASFEAWANGVSYFYKRGADSIIFLDIKDAEKNFRKLYKALAGNLVAQGFYPPHRFTPHISLGRLKKQRHAHEKKKILTEIAETEIPEIGNFMVEKLDVYESLYDPGADLPAGRHGKQRYHLLKSFKLSD